MDAIRSSYKTQNLTYEQIFKLLCFVVRPKKVVEFGILDGFSLKSFAKYCDNDCEILAYDIFEDFNGNHANQKQLTVMFKNDANVSIEKKDFYAYHDSFADKSIDILHIDIANTGDVYQFAIDNYLKKVSDNGFLVLEGGSKERDNVWWMTKYDKTKINSALDKLDLKRYCVIEPYPSLTIIKPI